MDNFQPEILIDNHKANSVIKITNDQDIDIDFSINSDDCEVDIWTNWQTEKFHSIIPQKNGKRLNILLSAARTGFFTVYFRYKKQSEKKYTKSGIWLKIHVDPNWIYDAIVYNVF